MKKGQFAIIKNSKDIKKMYRGKTGQIIEVRPKAVVLRWHWSSISTIVGKDELAATY